MFKDDLTRIKHMLDSARDSILFVKNKERKSLNEDRMLVLSLVKSIEIIGEAASKISNDLQSKYSTIPWKDIIGMRNRLIHTYFDIDYEIVWKTINDEIPVLISELERILSKEN